VRIDEREAAEMLGAFRLSDGLYAEEGDTRRITPSMLGDYLYCPALLWAQARLGLRVMTARGLVAAAAGRVLHERYERWASRHDNVLAEYRIEVEGLVGVIDLVVDTGSGLVPLELKSSPVPREAHARQLQAYAWLINAGHGYLVYRSRVERVERDGSVLGLIRAARAAIESPVPPRPARDCARCAFREACELAGVPVPRAATLDEWLEGARRASVEHEWGSVELY
jgi:CRISPR-associated exonuclease Cas4